MDEIRLICIDVLVMAGINHNLQLELESVDNDTEIYEARNSDFHMKISINHDLTVVHLLEKDEKIVDDDCDIELRFMDAAFEISLNKLETMSNGIDYADEFESEEKEINPYDPKLIRVETKNFPVQMIVDMINRDEIDLAPDFQRRFVWNDITRKSRLIESLLLRIPIPVFYFSQNEQGLFQVVDGVQRLTVLKSFMNNEFRLKNLEYLHDCEGLWYKKENNPQNSLDSLYTRRIEQTQLFINIIDPQTPHKVKYDIFRRINTGGKELNRQEIRNCLANTRTRNLLRNLVETECFKKATRNSIKSARMVDQELVLRFVAFYLIDRGKSTVKEYRGGMDGLLDITIEDLNNSNVDLHLEIKKAFVNSMENAYLVFGNNSFRKANNINKSLFLGISRVLCKYTREDLDKKNLTAIVDKFNDALKKDGELWNPLSMATNDAKNINFVYEYVKHIMES